MRPDPGAGLIETHDAALAFLDDRIGAGIKPGLDRMSGLMELMTSPQDSVPVVHVAGTNGKTTVTRLVGDLLVAADLRIGTFTSPHLERVEDRFTMMGRRITPDEFVTAVADVAPFVEIYEARTADAISYFELTAAIAFQLFAAAGLDAAVVEVGLGGRWDATNVVDAAVSVITGVAMDHMSYLGNSLQEIAAEKVAIVKDLGTLVTGPLAPEVEGPITAQVASVDAKWFRFGADFGVEDVERTTRGWEGVIRGLRDTYDDVSLALHGRHQFDHFATAVAVAETFVHGPLPLDVVRSVAGAARSPGRLEVLRRDPLVVVDGAHNEQGLAGLRRALDDEFDAARTIVVVGFRGDRDPVGLLATLDGAVDEVIATAADDPDAVPAEVVADAARAALPGVRVEAVTAVGDAVAAALARADADDAVVVTGSLYVVGDARVQLIEVPDPS